RIDGLECVQNSIIEIRLQLGLDGDPQQVLRLRLDVPVRINGEVRLSDLLQVLIQSCRGRAMLIHDSHQMISSSSATCTAALLTSSTLACTASRRCVRSEPSRNSVSATTPGALTMRRLRAISAMPCGALPRMF